MPMSSVPSPHVHRDVARSQVVELDLVDLVGEHEVLGVPSLAVAGLAQHLRSGLGQRPLVGYGDLEQRTVVGHDGQIYRLRAQSSYRFRGLAPPSRDLHQGLGAQFDVACARPDRQLVRL